tara:strand:- start:48 stop:674 length:627 start_codon:yes stop_codon:yes gene_type:complete
MSTLKTTNITHGSNSGTANMVLSSAGNVEARKVNGCQRIVLEQFYTPCDGSTIATANGNITVGDVTAEQDTSETYADFTGSSISYNPPTGTTQVIYEFDYHYSGVAASPLMHTKLFLAGAEVTSARSSHYHDNTRDAGRLHFKWGFNIGGSADADHGRVASWSSAKIIKLQVRSYASSLNARLNKTYYWEGSASAILSVPCVGITAIG